MEEPTPLSQEVPAQAGHSDQLQVVVFGLNGEEYGVPILEVQEIIPAGDITALPSAADYVAGVIDVRGSVATVVSLAKRFHLERADDGPHDEYIVLTQVGDTLFGVQVDEVKSVLTVPAESVHPASSMSGAAIDAEVVCGVAVVGTRVILILDVQRLLENEQPLTLPTHKQ